MKLQIKKIDTPQGKIKQLTFQHTFTDEYLSDFKDFGLTHELLDILVNDFKQMAKKALIDGAGQETEIINQKRLVSKIEDGKMIFNIE